MNESKNDLPIMTVDEWLAAPDDVPIVAIVENIQEAGSDLWQAIGRLYRQEHDTMPAPHYHVVEFINGCLNDSDSGPIETLDLARDELRSHVDGWAWGYGGDDDEGYIPAGEDRYQRGLYILTIEECTQDCDPNADS